MAETLIPEGRGKAEAMRTYLARGGGLTKMGRYRSGPMKDKTQAQAEVMFENHWQTVGDGVKEKYATRANNVLAPSERLIGGLTPAQPKTPVAAAENMSPAGVKITAPSVAPTTKTPVAAPQSPAAGPVIPGVKPSPVTSAPADRPKFARRGGTSVSGIAGRATNGASPSASPVAPSPAPIMPTTPAYNGRPELSSLAQRELASRKAAVDATPTGRPVVTNPAPGINRLTGLPFGYQPGDSQAPGGPTIDPTLAAQSEKRQQVAESKAALAPTKPLIPGITPKPQPTALSQSGINRPRTVGPNTVEGRAAAEMRRQAAINANPSTVNPDDPKKFFTGRVLPLDQLVKRQKLQGIGTPARQ